MVSKQQVGVTDACNYGIGKTTARCAKVQHMKNRSDLHPFHLRTNSMEVAIPSLWLLLSLHIFRLMLEGLWRKRQRKSAVK